MKNYIKTILENKRIKFKNKHNKECRILMFNQVDEVNKFWI